ncbi:hypothetical protein [Variovorax sp. DXTD-1]|uniref:hypothetical protein n=1 Tax=Variovorax sp. DXTD-1 TaxID=2495592 RepID=UPI000F885139|nr:hypothetical protein [Variovorax sp. DXTD-1]RST54119.1 hypothetical protein EJI00_03055 [Variovorax sp. DXTD-1]
MNAPQIREQNRKLTTHNMQVLAMLLERGLITCKIVQRELDLSPKYSRNIVCRLVRQKLAEQVTAKGYQISATYRITPAGRARVQAAQLVGAEPGDLAEDDADELAERAVARARIESNLAHARVSVPNSVFALGNSLSKPYVGASA